MGSIMEICSVINCNGIVDAKGLCSKHYKRMKTNGTTDDIIGSHSTLKERFFRFVDKSGDCWLWTGKSKSQKGYGQIQEGGKGSKHRSVHRLSYEFHFGEIPKGLVIMHKCDNPSCVNPDHLEAGTQSKNIKDAFLRGRKKATPPHKFGESHGATKLKNADVYEIRNSQEISAILSAKYGVSKSAIQRIKSRVTWGHLE